MLIGDSTMLQSYTALANMITLGFLTGHGTHYCGSNINFVLSDTLLGYNMGNYNRGPTWQKVINSTLPKIVIMGAGAHIKNISHFPVFLTELTDQIVRFPETAIATRYKEHRKSLSLYWKTQQPGGCMPDISHFAKHKKSCVDQQLNYSYNHGMFMDWDEQIIHQLLARTKVGITDMRMLYLRPDAHVGDGNCLHFNLRSDVLFSTFPCMVMDVLFNKDPSAEKEDR